MVEIYQGGTSLRAPYPFTSLQGADYPLGNMRIIQHVSIRRLVSGDNL